MALAYLISLFGGVEAKQLPLRRLKIGSCTAFKFSLVSLIQTRVLASGRKVRHQTQETSNSLFKRFALAGVHVRENPGDCAVPLRISWNPEYVHMLRAAVHCG